jgi:hypothetical protein
MKLPLRAGGSLPFRSSLFVSSIPFTLFDYFRVPYEEVAGPSDGRQGIATLSVRGETRKLSWPTAEAMAKSQAPASYLIGSIPIFGRVATDAQMRSWLGSRRRDWHVAHEVRDERGLLAGTILQRDDGSTFLPFDPNELIANYWAERYVDYLRPAAAGLLASLARRGYYRSRPFLPRSVQMSMRRSFCRIQSKARFPRWPVETALHDLYDLLFALLVAVSERPIPYIGQWPRNWSWALVLTHDVETQVGYDRLPELLQIELDTGYRSSWNFVPRSRYSVSDDLVRRLADGGFEVGVHGLYHDGRDLASMSTVRRRLPAIREYADRWEASGFRSPATLRSAELIPMLGFDYDSSYSDTAPFEPQPGGSCTWLPYMLGDVVELPITLVQDHTLFDLLGHRDGNVWLEKARFLRHCGGLALLLTHPDYIGNKALPESYRQILEEFADDATAWKALPRDVSDWWRRRSKSHLQETGGEWCVVGPAEGDARVEFMAPQALRV